MIRPPRFSQAGSVSIQASARAFVTTIVAATEIATLSRPFGAGTVFSTVGAVPGQLALSGGAIVKGASAAAGDTTYTITVRAESGDGAEAIEIALDLLALAPVVISGDPPAATVGQAYEHVFTASGPIAISLADQARLAAHGFACDLPGKRIFSTKVRA